MISILESMDNGAHAIFEQTFRTDREAANKLPEIQSFFLFIVVVVKNLRDKVRGDL